MAGQIDALRINVELLPHNPENIQNILLAEFSQILGILRSSTQKIALSFSLLLSISLPFLTVNKN